MSIAQITDILQQVKDPEIPVLSVVEMGIVERVDMTDPLVVTITPTYSGCPAMNTMAEDIRRALAAEGFPHAQVKTVLHPAWTTDRLTPSAKEKLKDYGIAPPKHSTSKSSLFLEDQTIACPKCQSEDTQLVSEFGSTPCKAHYKCKDCLEPFDYFKCI